MMGEASTILIVDDQEHNRLILHDQITALGHKTLLAENGLSALAQVAKHPPDLILLDIMMPEMDGFEMLERLKADSSTRHIPVVIITAVDELESVARCVGMGADDYISKPFNPTLLNARIDACLDKKRLHDQEKQYRRNLEEYNLHLEERVREKVKELTQAHLGTIFATSKLAESRDPETGEHLERMREYCKVLAGQLRSSKYSPLVDQQFVDDLYAASPLHDIGKVGIPDAILQKPGALTDEEFDIMKTHSTIGADTLRKVGEAFPGNSFVAMGIEIAQSHHERWDGSGYPQGLAGEEIPISARILGLADVYDALRSKRVYKDAFSHEKSREIIIEERGKHFDPEIVDAFLPSEETLQDIRERFQDPEVTQN